MTDFKTRPEFIIDGMLRGLVKWLRALGFSAVSVHKLSEISGFLNKNPETIFITASPFHWENILHSRKLLVRSHSIEGQLRALNIMYKIFEMMDLFSICLSCNTFIEPVSIDEIVDRIPNRVRDSFEEFWYCPVCERVYWHGGHVERMIRKLRSMKVPIHF
jgi:uncharacterized protein with PIN domain